MRFFNLPPCWSSGVLHAYLGSSSWCSDTFNFVAGLCDPYVTLRLLPEEFFGKEGRKTEIIKNTLFPLFDEQFDL